MVYSNGDIQSCNFHMTNMTERFVFFVLLLVWPKYQRPCEPFVRLQGVTQTLCLTGIRGKQTNIQMGPDWGIYFCNSRPAPTWNSHKTQWMFTGISLMSLKIGSTVCGRVCRCVCACLTVMYHEKWILLYILLKCLMVSKAMRLCWDVSNYKEKMEAGGWIHGEKALFNYCSADGTFMFSPLTHTQHVSDKKRLQCHITTYHPSVKQQTDIYTLYKHTHRHTAFPNLGWEHLPVSFILFHIIWNICGMRWLEGKWHTVSWNGAPIGSPISCSLTETWISHVLCGPVGYLEVQIDADTQGSAGMQQKWEDGVQS